MERVDSAEKLCFVYSREDALQHDEDEDVFFVTEQVLSICYITQKYRNMSQTVPPYVQQREDERFQYWMDFDELLLCRFLGNFSLFGRLYKLHCMCSH